MWLPGWVPQVIVKAARTRVRPLQDFFEGVEPLTLVGQPADASEAFEQPNTVVERIVQRVQAGAAIDRDRLIFLNAELHADTLEQGLAQSEDAPPPILVDVLSH